MSATLKIEPAPIEPQTLYPLADIKRRLGFGDHAMRQARRDGLIVRRKNGRAFLLGRDVIDYICGGDAD